jgi:hypothetical protein
MQTDRRPTNRHRFRRLNGKGKVAGRRRAGGPRAEVDDRADRAFAHRDPTATPPGANEADVGDCVDPELAVLDCGTPGAIYRVVLELEGTEECPAGPYMDYSMIGLGGWSLCLALDARPGQCFKTYVAEGFASADCAVADVQVVSVLTGKADGDACPPPPPNVAFHPRPLVYPTPPLTVCLAHVPK